MDKNLARSQLILTILVLTPLSAVVIVVGILIWLPFWIGLGIFMAVLALRMLISYGRRRAALDTIMRSEVKIAHWKYESSEWESYIATFKGGSKPWTEIAFGLGTSAFLALVSLLVWDESEALGELIDAGPLYLYSLISLFGLFMALYWFPSEIDGVLLRRYPQALITPSGAILGCIPRPYSLTQQVVRRFIKERSLRCY